MPIHWGIDGNIDGHSGKAFAIFFLPLFMLASHWFCIFCTLLDPKNKEQSNKAFGMVIWIIPIVTLFSSGMIYAASFGWIMKIDYIGTTLFGLLFLIIGNYLPKCKQNYTIGIRVKWALENEENWNATHRFGGRVWVIGGLVIMASMFCPKAIVPFVIIASIILLAFLPILYSYLYYKKQLKSGNAVFVPVPVSKPSKAVNSVIIIVLAIILIYTGVIMFAGDITISMEETSFTALTNIWSDLTIDYADIENIEYRKQDSIGSKTNGFDNVRLKAGFYRNDEFGNYTRYSHNSCDSCIILSVEGKTIVLNEKDDASTVALYDNFISRLSEIKNEKENM